MAGQRIKRIVRLQVHKFLYRAKCESCDKMIVAGEAIPIGMKDCTERDHFIDAFRTGSIKFLCDSPVVHCESCLLDHLINDAVDLLDLPDQFDDDE